MTPTSSSASVHDRVTAPPEIAPAVSSALGGQVGGPSGVVTTTMGPSTDTFPAASAACTSNKKLVAGARGVAIHRVPLTSATCTSSWPTR